MIPTIAKGSYVKGIIEYHEDKVALGKAECLVDTTLSQFPGDKIHRLLDVLELNPDVYQNKVIHFSLSFPNSDNALLTQSIKTEIAEKYLTEMGYSNTPFIIYEHFDTTKQHFHIIATSVDYDGQKIPEIHDYRKSMATARALEKEYGLTQVQSKNKDRPNERFSEMAAERYSIINGLKKLYPQGDRIGLFSILPPETIQYMILNKMSNEQMSAYLYDDKKKMGEIYEILHKNRAIEVSKKKMLIQELTSILTTATGADHFYQLCRKKDIYTRVLNDSKGNKYITYGIGEFYIKDKNLPTKFQHTIIQELGKTKEKTKSFTVAQQKIFLKRMVTRAFMQSRDVDQFDTFLKQNNIVVQYHKNSGGTYGISFSSTVHNAVVFKGSDIGLSINKYKTKFEINPVQKIEEPKTEKTTRSKSISAIKKFAKNLEQDEEKNSKYDKEV